MDEEQRTSELARQWQQRGSGISGGINGGITQVALGVVGVVEAPFDDRRAGDGGVKDVGSTQHRKGGNVAAEAPPANGNAGEIEWIVGGGSLQRSDLILEHDGCEIAMHRPLPLAAAPGSAAPIGDHDRETLIGKPLRGQVAALCVQHALRVRTGVRIQQYRQGRAVVPVGQQHCRGDAVCAVAM